MQVAKGVIGLVVVGHYPLNHHPARLAMEDLERYYCGWTTVSRPVSLAHSFVFIWTSVAVSVVVRLLGRRTRPYPLACRTLLLTSSSAEW